MGSAFPEIEQIPLVFPSSWLCWLQHNKNNGYLLQFLLEKNDLNFHRNFLWTFPSIYLATDFQGKSERDTHTRIWIRVSSFKERYPNYIAVSFGCCAVKRKVYLHNFLLQNVTLTCYIKLLLLKTKDTEMIFPFSKVYFLVEF